MSSNKNKFGEKRLATTHYGESFHFPKKIKKGFDWAVKPTANDPVVLGSDFVTYKPKDPLDSYTSSIKFELTDNFRAWALGINTFFHIEGTFELSKPAGADPETDPEIDWRPCTEQDINKCIVAPNWFDMLFQDIHFSHGKQLVRSSEEKRYLKYYVDTFKYAYMDEDQKRLLMPQDCHPGRGIPTLRGGQGWSFDEGSEWMTGNYAKAIFSGGKITFDYMPLDFGPWFQGTNFMENPSKVLPMPVLEPIMIDFIFTNYRSCIFRKPAESPYQFRFNITKFNFVAEKLTLFAPFEKQFLKKSVNWEYEGVSRKTVTVENLQAASQVYQWTIPNVLLPEGMLIFAVPREVTSGTCRYQDNTTHNVFRDHNIQNIDFEFDNRKFFYTVPHIGMINNEIIARKLYIEYQVDPPFELKMDPKRVNLDQIVNGAVQSPFPHVWIKLTNFQNKTRIAPVQDDGQKQGERKDLTVKFSFGNGGSPENAMFVICLYYGGNNLTFHGSDSKWTCPFLSIN